MLALILALSRIIVSESGFTPTDDGPAIVSVIYDRAERMDMSPLSAARAYCPQSFNRERTDRRKWIAHLSLSGAKPHGWPANVSWERRRPLWLALTARVTELVKHPHSHSCSESPMHWGARWFSRPRQLGWLEVDCGDTRNTYYVIPADRD